ncbi:MULTISPECIES: hypothetical protein [unclassified Streptomyces]|uniref:hypothetical protein n=1 Tax=unclassified Streptomyces TaxID=2593676 RepID=UPI000DAD4DF7|nr:MULTISPECIES: hypothetical protein [unclassified Streptomyces]PZT75200.1 hypothetical protein DNK55_24690 [Streptomyces sp. AC1-42T]PZT75408.1 hypothetical protein DNK56_18050 [Streptomyces sp. AC1-42W]PZT80360.1 hypothetical protein DNK55_12925 [Streptomyces sp. AC1-42T]PZT80712.1 hypothetical protein DNK56_00125 [Streptomyces sp. AC1-42W]
MSRTAFRPGVECSYPLPHAGPDARLGDSLISSVAGVLVGYGLPRLTAQDRAALETALVAFVYNSQESNT